MTPLFLLAVALRAAFVFGVMFAALAVARRASASLRRCLLLLGLGAALALPAIASTFPGRPLIHVAAPAFAGRAVAEALSKEGGPVLPSGARRSLAVRPAKRASVGRGLFFLWALGALVVVLRVLAAQLAAHSLAARAEAARSGLYFSRDVAAPVVVGALWPRVLLPSAAARWSEERLRAVILHESAHVRRRDGLALLVAHAACALYWFQPLAWLSLRELRRECELAADEDVIAAGLRASSYAEHLLAIARGLSVPAAGIAMAARPSELGRRIQVLLSRERLPPRFTRGQAVLLAALASLMLGFVACTDAAHESLRSPAAAPVAGAGAGAGPRAAGHAPLVDSRLQSIAEEEAKRVHAEWGARRVAIVVLDPHSGALLASSDDAPDQPVVPASTLKPLTVAMALDSDLITPEQHFDCGNGERAYGSLVLRDAAAYGSLDAAEILAVSSNIGVSRIFDVLGGERLNDGLRRFRVGAPASIPDRTMRGAIVAIGEGSTATPLALATAYGVFANDGLLVSGAAEPERVIKGSTARALREMLEGVVNGERATGKAAAVPGVRVGGKTGTSDDPECESCAHSPGTFASFVGIVPIDRPRWVIYVGVGEPNREGSGGTIAAPAFARIASRAMAL